MSAMESIIIAIVISVEKVAVGESPSCEVFWRKNHIFGRQRPLHACRGVIETQRALGLGAVVVVYLVLELGRFRKDGKSVGEAAGYVQLASVFG